MFKAKSRRPVFLSAAILMILLGTVLIGSTFASGGIYDGTAQGAPTNDQKYNVSLSYYNGETYVPLLPPAGPINSTLWCPGKTEILYLKLENNEDFATSCTLTLNVTNTGFGDTLTYAIIDGDLLEKTEAYRPKSWDDFKSKSRGGKDTVLRQGSHKLLEKKLLDPVTGGEDCYLALAIHMSENTSSDYQGKTMKFDFVLQVDAVHEPGTTFQ